MRSKKLVSSIAVIGGAAAVIASMKNRKPASQSVSNVFVSNTIDQNKSDELYIVLPKFTGDCTTQLKSYIERARVEGKTLLIPKKNDSYIISDELQVSCNIQSNGAKISGSVKDRCVFVIQNQEHLTISGLEIQVNASTSANDVVWGKHCGIKVENSKNIKLENLRVSKYWGAAISLNNCFYCSITNVTCFDSISTNELWPTSTEHGDTDIAVISDTKGGNNIVHDCKCISHKSSIGIWLNAHGKDSNNTLSNNFCAGLLPNLESATLPDLKKRHGIQVGYFDSDNRTFNRVVNNYCFNTGTTGISGAARGTKQVVHFLYNVCEKNGIGSVDGTILRAGINFQAYGKGCVCKGNTILDFQTDAFDAGALSIVVGATDTQEGSLHLVDNFIENSSSHGIYLAYRARNLVFQNTSILKSAKSDVMFFDMTADTHDIYFYNTYTERANAAFPSFRIQNVVDLKGFAIRGGVLKGSNNTLSNEDNVGIFLLTANNAATKPIEISDLKIENFGTGIGIYSPFAVDVRAFLIIKDITFCSLVHGLAARTETAGILPLFDCKFLGVTNRTNGWGYANAARVAEVTYSLAT